MPLDKNDHDTDQNTDQADSLDNMLQYQEDISSHISKALSNYKKAPKERLTEGYAEGRLQNLDKLWIQFTTGHENLLRSISRKLLSKTDYMKEDLYDITEETYLTCRSLIKELLKSFTPDATEKLETKYAEVKVSQVRLPKINIPVFSGKYTEWNTFRDLFCSLIHNNQDIDNVQKLNYLKGYLSGEAEQLLRHIPISETNYIRCWDLLEQRYNNKKYICNITLKRLLSQRTIFNESPNGLKDLIDTTNDCLSSLKNIGVNVDSWDVIVIHILTLKLDPETRRQWEFGISNSNANDELPTFSQFIEFLTNRYRAMEFLPLENRIKSIPKQQLNPNNQHAHTFHAIKMKCPFCSEEHNIGCCKKFAKESIEARRAFVQSNNICFSCLENNHSAKFCENNIRCNICNRKHHTILHPNSANDASKSTGEVKVNFSIEENSDSGEDIPSPNKEPVVSCVSTRKVFNKVLLATALVKTRARNGDNFVIRALLDQGSQSSFITESTVQCLGLKKIPITNKISGVGGNVGLGSKAMVEIKIMSRIDPKVIISVRPYVLKSITSFIPSSKIESFEWDELSKIVLADPEFHTPNRIDMLLGAEVYGQIIQEGVKKAPHGSPVAQFTSLGWILSGLVPNEKEVPSFINAMHCTVDENDQLKRFWELEADPPKPEGYMVMSDEDSYCEELFSATTIRDNDGRYIVRLPIKGEKPEVTNSLKIAERRFYSLERRLNTDPILKEKYREVINEYLELNHMELVPDDEIDNPNAIYLPHHAIVREDRDTTKVRPVFDASCKGENQKSLNDNLYVGPTLQPELRHTIMRWRLSPICMTADIVKMYRQIKVAKEDTDYQRILWRDDEKTKIKHFRMLRVTFGVASAPYLAFRALQQVALDERVEYGMAAIRVYSDFYVDDLLTGCETKEEGIEIYKQMNALLEKGGFELQKWTSNSEELLLAMKEREWEKAKTEGKANLNEKGDVKNGLKIKDDEVIKIVGLTWKRNEDSFRYKVNLPVLNDLSITKRKIISDISRFYDPLGWAGPSIVIPKILIQKLWLAGLNWDDEVPNSLLDEWFAYREELKMLENVSIPRWVQTMRNNQLVELHGFSDASKVAYAAVVYSRVIDAKGKVHVALISSKTKVAPVKQVSIPRLELCGAVLLTKLMIEIAEVMKIEKSHLHAWTDSTIVLAWLNSHPSKWKVFVANRVSEILTNLDSHHWSHVTSKQNSADSASRGLHPSDLVNNIIWFQGPDFLHSDSIAYDKPKDLDTNLEQATTFYVNIDNCLWERFSSLTKMIRVIAFCKRFYNNCKNNNKTHGILSANELKNALIVIIKQNQIEHFRDDISIVKKMGVLPKKSNLRFLNPYLDDEDILRVGGRLTHASLPEDRKHPILFPKSSNLSKLIVNHAHKQTLHGGPQLMLSYIQSKYWIVGAKQLVKSCFRKCVTCAKASGVTQTQLMGQLPTPRVTPIRPFKNSGVDYAGPIQIRTTKGRGHKSYKGYICLFVCMATRAVHLEVVTDLTSEGFLQAFKRFVARRGHCSDIWSDNGTNFTGAASELKRLFVMEQKSMLNEVAESLATNNCNWHFIPSRSPNFGGLWEAGVKSVKYHLKRVVGQSTLTYEEMSTVLAQIEACLNSRPLSALPSDESSEVSILTPGHFLIGESLLSPPDRNYESSNISSLRRWQYTQRIVQDFWRRWSQEYLITFYHRYKWTTQNTQLKIGDVVLVKEEGLPTCRWMYGRVVDVHPGRDNIIRVVTIKVRNGTLKRPVTKICVLPIAE